MPKLIKDKAVVDDSWVVLQTSDQPEAAEVADGKVIVPLSVWKAQKAALSDRKAELGVWLDSNELAEELGEEAQGFGIVGINFPGFMDGRGFTAARLLRERYGYEGELRAIGHVIRDQLFYLQRCGFNSFVLDESVDLEKALESFGDFSESYQAACDEKLPLFRRRA